MRFWSVVQLYAGPSWDPLSHSEPSREKHAPATRPVVLLLLSVMPIPRSERAAATLVPSPPLALIAPSM